MYVNDGVGSAGGSTPASPPVRYVYLSTYDLKKKKKKKKKKIYRNGKLHRSHSKAGVKAAHASLLLVARAPWDTLLIFV